MATSTAYSKGALLFLQLNRLSSAGVALTGTSDAIVLPGDCINQITDEDLTTTDALQDDGCVVIPERIRRTGQRLTITTGSKVDVDMLVLLGQAGGLVSGGAQIGWQETVAGGVRCVCGGSGAVSVSCIAFYEAWQCSACVGVAVRAWPSVSLTRTGQRQTQRTTVLSTYQYQGQYVPNSGWGRGPGNLLPTGLTITGGGIEILQSPTTAVSPLTVKTPVVPAATPSSPSTDNCQSCGLLPAGFLSSPWAVGGALNGIA